MRPLISRLWLVGLFLVLPVLIFFPLLRQMSTALLDWNDYPYIVWTVMGNVEKFRTFAFAQFFETNAFASFRYSLLFSDTLLPQSLIALFYSLFVSNPILIFNLTFFSILTLNSLTAYLFWGRFFRSSTRLMLVLLTAYSPYVFIQLDHFQMLNLWPFFLGMYFLSENSSRARGPILAGLLAGVQFAASVYLFVFYLCTACLYLLLYCSTILSWQRLRRIALLFLVSSVLATAPLALKYMEMRSQYEARREYGEYVSFAAHLSDYVFSTHLHSTLNRLEILKKWNSYNRHVGEAATFPGFVLSGLALIALVRSTRTRGRIGIGIEMEKKELFFLSLIIVGMLFSLGPRLNVNGSFVHIPLPYHVVMKIIPFVEPVRATARWSLLVYLGLAYFAAKTLVTIEAKKRGGLLIGVLGLLYVLEVVPIGRRAESRAYYPPSYQPIEHRCQSQPQVLLEYPLTQQHAEANLISNLSFRTTMLLASTQHGCRLVNGYSGFAPKAYDMYEQALTQTLRAHDAAQFFTLLRDRNVTLLRVHYDYLATEDRETLQAMLQSDPDWQTVAVTDTIVLYSRL